MANYIISSRECVFPSVSYAALELYKPNASTHYLAWRGGVVGLNVLVCSAFDLAYQVGAITAPAQCMSENVNERLIYLLQGVNQSWLETITWYFRALNVPYLSCNPYNVALRKRLQEVDELERDGQAAEFVMARKCENARNGKGFILD